MCPSGQPRPGNPGASGTQSVSSESADGSGWLFRGQRRGHLVVVPERDPKRRIDLRRVIEGPPTRRRPQSRIRLRDLLKALRLTEGHAKRFDDTRSRGTRYTGSYCCVQPDPGSTASAQLYEEVANCEQTGTGR